MLIDCDECVMQHTSACDDCIVTVLLGAQAPRLSDKTVRRVELDDAETDAIDNLADAGLVPRLRLLKRASNE
jgi:hypothetical protein